MSDPSALRPARADGSPIPFRAAVGTWAAAWLLGAGLLAGLILAAISDDLDSDPSIPALALAALVGWVAFAIALVVASKRYGSGRFDADYAVEFTSADLVGIPLGVITQLLLVPALYWPLQQVWPDTFDQEAIEERARDLADRADGGLVVLLVAVVVVGAPIVEELVYRGLIQRSLSNMVSAWPALTIASFWFAVIHFAWVELPGLALAGFVFGACVVLTGRLGMAIVTHAAFNAAGLALVLGAR